MSAARHTRGPRQARLDLLNANARKVLAAMLGGASLRLDRSRGSRWSLSDGRPVENAVAREVIADPDVIAVGDTLFAETLSQTFRHVGAKKP
jgi:hypothetical protein